MAVLGVGGRLFLRREAPEPCIAGGGVLDNDNDSLVVNCPTFWNGDHVTTSCLPVADGGNVLPPNPQGWATYFSSRWFLGPNRDHIASTTDGFYKQAGEEYPDGQDGDDAQFYARVGDVVDGETIRDCENGEYWVHVDELGRFSFYTNRCAALQGGTADRVTLEGPVAGGIGIAPYGHADYNNAIWRCFAELGEYRQANAEDTITLESICEDPPLYENPVAGTDEYDNADVIPRGANQGTAWPYWQIICDLREWSLELSAPSVDTTAISEKFGEAVKSIVTGGGSAEFLIDRKCYDDNRDNGLLLMKLLLMTEKGCKAAARFYLMSRTEGELAECVQLPGDLYYESELLVTASAVNVRPTEILAGTANFITTGVIKLLEAT